MAISTVVPSASEIKDEKEKHYSRNENNIEVPEKYDKEFFAEWDFSVSANCHQFGAQNRDNIKYVSPNSNPVGHFFEDVLPWLFWENSPQDSTTWWEEDSAFLEFI